MSSLKIGDSAPHFRLPSSFGGIVDSKDLLGRNLVVYFYPKDDTPVCTQEAKDFKEEFSALEELDTIVLGISKDSIKAHRNFSTRYDLPFHLLSDESAEVIERYGAWVEKSMFGKKYLGIERSTFFIDSCGKIQGIWRKIKVRGHVAEVLEFIRKHLVK